MPQHYLDIALFVTAKRKPSREHLVQHDSHTVHITPTVITPLPKSLWCHIQRSPDDSPSSGQEFSVRLLTFPQKFGDAEIQQLDDFTRPSLMQKNIFGLEETRVVSVGVTRG